MTDEASTESGDLRTLALYFLAKPYVTPHRRYGTPAPPPTVDLQVGTIPATFPQDVPLVPGDNLLGCLIIDEKLFVVLQSNQDPAEVIAWYQDRMTAAGWREPERYEVPAHGGFAFAPPGTEPERHDELTFCRTPTGPSLQVLAWRPDGEGTIIELQVNLSTDPRVSPCTAVQRRQRDEERLRMYATQIIPPLYPPPGSHQRRNRGEVSRDETSQSAMLVTDLDLAAVAVHYATQLETGGWQRRSGGLVERVAWSRWRFDPPEGTNGRGYFLILGDEDRSGHFDLEIRASWDWDEVG